jgi:hypothetical protein
MHDAMGARGKGHPSSLASHLLPLHLQGATIVTVDRCYLVVAAVTFGRLCILQGQ